jgi:hypothetical protein
MRPSERLAIFNLQYFIRALFEKRRDVVRRARSLPKGPERNQLRQIASSREHYRPSTELAALPINPSTISSRCFSMRPNVDGTGIVVKRSALDSRK